MMARCSYLHQANRVCYLQQTKSILAKWGWKQQGSSFWWTDMDKQAAQFVKNCVPCNIASGLIRQSKYFATNSGPWNAIWTKVAIDVMAAHYSRLHQLYDIISRVPGDKRHHTNTNYLLAKASICTLRQPVYFGQR